MWFILLLVCVVSADVTEELTTSDIEYTSITTDVYNSSDFAIDDCNNSICLNSSTTQANKITTTTKPPKGSKRIQRESKSVTCLCDLQINICDINCCCDPDCSYEKKMIFDHCISVDKTYLDKRACQYVQYDYVNLSIHEWEVQNNDLFCVVRTNVPASYVIEKSKPFIKYEDTILEKNLRYDWPKELSDEDDIHKEYSGKYIQGSSLWIILDNSSMDKLKIHEAFISSGCNLQVEAEYLRDTSSECVHIVKGGNKYLDAGYYSSNIFLAKPTMFNITKMRNKFTKCSSPACLTPTVQICSDFDMDNCTKSKSPDISLKCTERNGNNTCKNVVQSLKYKFIHGTVGINEIILSIFLKNVSFEIDIQYEILQRMSIEFEWAGTERNFSNKLSGNPGYLLKKPILIGNLVNGTIHRMWDSYRDNFMVLPLEDKGLCKIGRNSYQPIEFRYNTILLCQIRGTLATTKSIKPTDLCKMVQVEIFKYWNILELKGDFINKTFGQFGNANNSIPDNWKNILYEKTPKNVLNNISGRFSNKNATLQCSKLILGMNIDIYHARVSLKKIVDQEKILGVTHRFQKPKNVTLSITNSYLNYDFDLDTKAAFWDVTSPKFKKLADTPSLNIRLPSDFFYPFVKVGNSAYRNLLSYHYFMTSFFIQLYLVGISV